MRDRTAERRPPESEALTIENMAASAALRELSRVAALPIVVAPSATELAACVRVTVLAPQSVPRAQLLRLFANALESTPLEVQQRPDGWLVQRRAGAALPDSCAGMAYRESALADIARRQRESVAAATTSAQASPDAGLLTGWAEPTDELTTSLIAGVGAIDENTYTVTRAARDAMFSNVETMLRTVRILPHYDQGVMRGLRLYGIRRASLIAALGLRNGDTLISINDVPLTDPQRSLEAFDRLRRAERASVAIERRGERQTLSYRLADSDAAARGARG